MFQKLMFWRNRVSVSERAFVARQLATMLTSGLAIDRAVSILASQFTNQFLIESFRQIEADLEAGLAFSTAIGKHPKLFNRVFVNVIMAGEAVGKVSEVLQDLANQLEMDQDFASKLKAALYYPIFVMVAMIGIGIVLMIRVIPQFKTIFEDANAELPLMTNILIGTSEWLAGNWLLFISLVILAFFGLSFFFKSPQGKLLLDWLAIKLPVGLLRDLYMSRLTRTLALLTQSGTPIIEALSITGDVMNNQYYKAALGAAREDISRGIPLSVPLSKYQIFPPIVAQMILVGEQTGRMDQILANLAVYFESETSNKLKGLSSLFEPAMLMIVGLAVAFMVFAIFIPLYSITQFV